MIDAAGGRTQRKLRNMLLDRGFQLKYVGFVLSLSLVLSMALGFFLIKQMTENSRMVLLDSDLDPVFREALIASDAQSVWVLVAMLAVFNVFLAIGTIVLTHRVVGPVYVFRRFLKEIEEGSLPPVRKLRKGDEFVRAHQQLCATVDALRERVRNDAEVGRRLLEWLDTGDLDLIRSEVSRWVDDKDRALQMRPSCETTKGAS